MAHRRVVDGDAVSVENDEDVFADPLSQAASSAGSDHHSEDENENKTNETPTDFTSPITNGYDDTGSDGRQSLPPPATTDEVKLSTDISTDIVKLSTDVVLEKSTEVEETVESPNKENRNDPTFVPRNSRYYMHDDRSEDVVVKAADKRGTKRSSKTNIEPAPTKEKGTESPTNTKTKNEDSELQQNDNDK
eukprot:Platyproteum_vivax@DN8749_c0_g1_i1.p1